MILIKDYILSTKNDRKNSFRLLENANSFIKEKQKIDNSTKKEIIKEKLERAKKSRTELNEMEMQKLQKTVDDKEKKLKNILKRLSSESSQKVCLNIRITKMKFQRKKGQQKWRRY